MKWWWICTLPEVERWPLADNELCSLIPVAKVLEQDAKRWYDLDRCFPPRRQLVTTDPPRFFPVRKTGSCRDQYRLASKSLFRERDEHSPTSRQSPPNPHSHLRKDHRSVGRRYNSMTNGVNEKSWRNRSDHYRCSFVKARDHKNTGRTEYMSSSTESPWSSKSRRSKHNYGKPRAKPRRFEGPTRRCVAFKDVRLTCRMQANTRTRRTSSRTVLLSWNGPWLKRKRKMPLVWRVSKARQSLRYVHRVLAGSDEQTHAAFNSATTGRTRRTTQAETKTLGSPSRRQQQEKVATKKVEPVTHNAPSKFGGLNNGFASSPKIRRTAPADQSPVPDLHREATPEIAPEFQVEYASASEDNSPAWSERSQVSARPKTMAYKSSSSITS